MAREARNTHPLVKQFVKLLNERASWKEIESSGVPRQTIENWLWRAMPKLDNFDAVLNAMGFELAIVPKSGIAKGNLVA